MLNKNATSPPTTRAVVVVADISIDKSKKGRIAIAAQAMLDRMKRK